MLFSSNVFLYFYLPITLALYYISPRKIRNLVLFLVSLFFYGWGEPVYLLLMVATILLNYICGAVIEHRKQFGKPICKQQYLAFKMAELQTDIQAAELMLHKAALDKEEGRPYTVSAAMAKLTCTNVAMKVTEEAVQMLGGNGYMKGYHVERMMRDAKITQIYEGTNEIQKLVISGQLFR